MSSRRETDDSDREILLVTSPLPLCEISFKDLDVCENRESCRVVEHLDDLRSLRLIYDALDSLDVVFLTWSV